VYNNRKAGASKVIFIELDLEVIAKKSKFISDQQNAGQNHKNRGS